MAVQQPVPASALRQVAVQAAQKYGVDPNIFIRQIQAESGFDPTARSSAGAEGIAQFMPGTAASYHIDPFNPNQALDAAARYDANELHAFGGDYRKALAAYNAGAGNADKFNDPNFAGGQTFNYVRKILGGTTSPAAQTAATGAKTSTVRLPAAAGSGLNTQLLARLLRSNDQILGIQPPTNLGTLFAQPQAAPTAPVLPTPTLPQAKIPAQVATEVVGATGHEQPQFLQALAQLAAYEGHPVDITSGYRSPADQAHIYATSVANGTPGIQPDGLPVAKPGSSLHQKGLAADGTINGIPLGALPAAILARFGLATVPGDRVHVQLAGGR